jgi:hypothetical protein
MALEARTRCATDAKNISIRTLYDTFTDDNFLGLQRLSSRIQHWSLKSKHPLSIPQQSLLEDATDFLEHIIISCYDSNVWRVIGGFILYTT